MMDMMIITNILDSLYAVWQQYEGYGDDADDAYCIAYMTAIKEIRKEGYDVTCINGRHMITKKESA